MAPTIQKAMLDAQRFKLVMAGERTGKSFNGAVYAVLKYLYTKLQSPEEKQLFWLIGKDYEASLAEFDYLVELFVMLGLLDGSKNVFKRDQGRDKSSFRLDDSSLFVETMTGGDPQKIARLAPHGILGCEVAQWYPELFQRAAGRLVQRKGWLLEAPFQSVLSQFYPQQKQKQTLICLPRLLLKRSRVY